MIYLLMNCQWYTYLWIDYTYLWITNGIPTYELTMIYLPMFDYDIPTYELTMITYALSNVGWNWQRQYPDVPRGLHIY